MKDKKMSSDGVVLQFSLGSSKKKTEVHGFASGGKSEFEKQLEREARSVIIKKNPVPYITK